MHKEVYGGGSCVSLIAIYLTRVPQTAYTKDHPTQPSSWLCVSCCYALGIDPFAKAKKASKPIAIAKKEDRAKIVHYEQRKGVASLGDMCIEVNLSDYRIDRLIFLDDREVYRRCRATGRNRGY